MISTFPSGTMDSQVSPMMAISGPVVLWFIAKGCERSPVKFSRFSVHHRFVVVNSCQSLLVYGELKVNKLEVTIETIK